MKTKMYIGESQAKGIVKRDLRNWHGTSSELKEVLFSIFRDHKGLSTIKKRDDKVRKYINKLAPKIYMKVVDVPLSSDFKVFSSTVNGHKTPEVVSKSERKRRRLVAQKMNQATRDMSKNTVIAFVVKRDDDPNDEDLHIITMVTEQYININPGSSLLKFNSLTCIKKHCLERVVQRMNFTNIKDALDEIVSSLPWLLASGDELSYRPESSYRAEGFKRHIPSKSGALLLASDLSDIGSDRKLMNTSLITWIHKEQFKESQEVSKSDFIFAIQINQTLSSPECWEHLDKVKGEVVQLEVSECEVNIQIEALGQRYPVQRYIHTLEAGEYLDFIIDFEK